MDENGFIDSRELEIVARSFNPQANVDQEVKIILGKLDKNQDSKIDLGEWVTVLFDLFQFMNIEAFDKHCEELLTLLRTNADAVRAELAAAVTTAATAATATAATTAATHHHHPNSTLRSPAAPAPRAVKT